MVGAKHYGPGLARESKKFRQQYGEDAELLKEPDHLIDLENAA